MGDKLSPSSQWEDTSVGISVAAVRMLVPGEYFTFKALTTGTISLMWFRRNGGDTTGIANFVVKKNGLLGNFIGTLNPGVLETTVSGSLSVVAGDTIKVEFYGVEARYANIVLRTDTFPIYRLIQADQAQWSMSAGLWNLTDTVYTLLMGQNALLWSEDLSNGVWSRGSLTLTANAVTAPDGTLTADKLVPTTASATDHRFDITPTLSTSLPQIYSGFAKWAGYDYVRVNTISKAGTSINSWINIGNGTIAVNGAGHTIQVLPAAYGFYRYLVGFDSGAGATATRLSSYTTPNLSQAAFAGDGTSGAYFWGMQLQKDTSIDTGYRKTTSAAIVVGAAGSLVWTPSTPAQAMRVGLWRAVK